MVRQDHTPPSSFICTGWRWPLHPIKSALTSSSQSSGRLTRSLRLGKDPVIVLHRSTPYAPCLTTKALVLFYHIWRPSTTAWGTRPHCSLLWLHLKAFCWSHCRRTSTKEILRGRILQIWTREWCLPRHTLSLPRGRRGSTDVHLRGLGHNPWLGFVWLYLYTMLLY